MLCPLLLGAQSTFYWAGNVANPTVGGGGFWNTFDSSWSSSSAFYSPATWTNGGNIAVLGGSTGGTITISGGLSGSQLNLQQNYMIDTQGDDLTFTTLGFSGGATNLTLTGGGTFSAGISAGTITLTGAGTRLKLGSGLALTNSTVVTQDGTFIDIVNRASVTGTAALELHGTATVRLLGGALTVGAISSASYGAGVIENEHGIRTASFTVNQTSGVNTYSGLIRDSSSGPQSIPYLIFAKDGAGVLILDGSAKTHSGGTQISGGTLRMGGANILPASGTVFVGLNSAGNLDLNGFDTVIGGLNSNFASSTVTLGGATLTVAGLPAVNGGGSFAGVISGNGGLIKTGGSGIQTLGGANTYSGGTVVEGGTLHVAHASALGSGPVTFKAGTTLSLGVNTFAKDIYFESGEVAVYPGSTGGSRTLSGVLSGAATLNFTGSTGSGFTLTGANTYTGDTKVSGLTLIISADAALGGTTGGLALNDSVLQWAQSFNLAPTRAIALTGGNSIRLNGNSTVISQAITGTGGLYMGSTGTLTLAGSNTFSGGLTIGQGTVVVGADSALGGTGGPVVLGTATLRFTNTTVLDATRSVKIRGFSTGTISVDAGATVMVPLTIDRDSSMFAANLAKAGAGTLVLDATSAYGGTTSVQGGILKLSGGNDILPTGQPVGVSSGVLDLDGHNQTVAGVGGFGTINPNGGTLTVTGSSSFQGVFAGSGTIRLTGGTLNLSGASIFVGAYQIEAGSLELIGSLDSGSTLLMSNGTTLSGGGTAGSVLLASGATLAPVSSYQVLTAGNTTLVGGVKYAWDIADPTGHPGLDWDQFKVNGTLTITTTPGNPLVLDVNSHAPYSSTGLAVNFNPAEYYSFAVIETTGGINGFDPGAVALNLTGFQNSYTGVFRVALANSGHDLAIVYAPKNLAGWTGTHFTADELLDPASSGPTADPDHDGLTNLLEYALDLEPKSGSTTGLPSLSTDSSNWLYTYSHPDDRTDLSYQVEMSTDLLSWSSTGVTHGLASSAGGIETWRATYPLASAPHVFFRLVVTRL